VYDTAAASNAIWRICWEFQRLELAPSINHALTTSIIKAGLESALGCTADEPTKAFVASSRWRAASDRKRPMLSGYIDRIFDNPKTTLEDLNVLPAQGSA
jgi:hypothetical protein